MDSIEHWGLKEKPFEDIRNPKFYYESGDHREALDRLLYTANDKNMGIGVLTGEIGSGKTMTRKVFERSLSKHEFEVVGIDSSGLEFNDLLYDVLKSITFRNMAYEMANAPLQDKREDKYYLLEEFGKRLRHINETENRHFVILIDEAQQLSASALDGLKNLTNLGTEQKNYLTLILIGQPELRGTVKAMQQINSRVSLRFHLNNLDSNDTRKYIQHRLRVAGCPRENIFSAESIEAVYRSTSGIPREINRVCKIALDYGYGSQLDEIGFESIKLVIEDINRHS